MKKFDAGFYTGALTGIVFLSLPSGLEWILLFFLFAVLFNVSVRIWVKA